MRSEPFTVQHVEQTIMFADDESGDYDESYDEGTIEPVDLRGALDALQGNYWDSLDERGDGTVICYPADSSQDMRTGEWTSTTLIIKSRRPEWTTRLVSLYHARQDARKRWRDRSPEERARIRRDAGFTL